MITIETEAIVTEKAIRLKTVSPAQRQIFFSTNEVFGYTIERDKCKSLKVVIIIDPSEEARIAIEAIQIKDALDITDEDVKRAVCGQAISPPAPSSMPINPDGTFRKGVK